MKDYIIKTTRSMRAEWNSQNILYSLRKGFQFVYLFDCIKTQQPWTNCQTSCERISRKLMWFQFTVRKYVDNLSFLRQTINKYKSWHEAVSDPKAKYCKNGLNAVIFFRVLEKRGKNLLWLLANAWKTMVTVDWRPPKRRFELKKKPFEGAC